MNFYFDVEDVQAAGIYCQKFAQTSLILGVECKLMAIKYGEDDKAHIKLSLDGPPEDVDMFLEFIEESLKLGEKGDQEEGN
jgi:hypothetical protein